MTKHTKAPRRREALRLYCRSLLEPRQRGADSIEHAVDRGDEVIDAGVALVTR